MNEALRKMNRQGSCRWVWDDDGFWATECGQSFVLNDGNPKENGMNFCYSCGGRLTVGDNYDDNV